MIKMRFYSPYSQETLVPSVDDETQGSYKCFWQMDLCRFHKIRTPRYIETHTVSHTHTHTHAQRNKYSHTQHTHTHTHRTRSVVYERQNLICKEISSDCIDNLCSHTEVSLQVHVTLSSCVCVSVFLCVCVSVSVSLCMCVYLRFTHIRC